MRIVLRLRAEMTHRAIPVRVRRRATAATIVPTLLLSEHNPTATGATRRSKDNTTRHPAIARLRRDRTPRQAAAIQLLRAATPRHEVATPLQAVLPAAGDLPAAAVEAEVLAAVVAVLTLATNLASSKGPPPKRSGPFHVLPQDY